jgi:alkanesulfonate monooxygenase|tara:strand:+ start:9732 stop:10847 length:1116 start_codon:yes stop_codon:yes gene_type:complete
LSEIFEPRGKPKFDWFIPIDGDGEHIGTDKAEIPPTFDYLKKVALTAEKSGFYSLLVPTRFSNGLFDENAPLAETWTTVAALASVTEKIRFLVAVRPGFISVGLFAQMAATLDQISGGRLDLNIVPGGIEGDMERLGEKTDHDTRYERASEFISACKKLWEKPEAIKFNGEFIHLNGAVCSPGPKGNPAFYLGGASEAALNLSADKADTYLAWILPQETLEPHLKKARKKYMDKGRSPRFGLRTHLIVRQSEREAWEIADELLSQTSESVLRQRAKSSKNTSMVGQRSQTQQYENDKMGRHLWNGISNVRVNCGTAIVGNVEQVSEELLSYWRLGIDEFILSGFPHVTECNIVSEQLLPVLKDKIDEELSV